MNPTRSPVLMAMCIEDVTLLILRTLQIRSGQGLKALDEAHRTRLLHLDVIRLLHITYLAVVTRLEAARVLPSVPPNRAVTTPRSDTSCEGNPKDL